MHGLRHLVLCWVLPVQVFAPDVRAHQGGVDLGWGQGRGRLSLVADFLITPSIKLLERKLRLVITRIRRFDAVDGIGGGVGILGAGAAPDSRAFGVDTSPDAL